MLTPTKIITTAGEILKESTPSMLRVYFDTTVYDHIDKDDVPMTDLDALRSALSNKQLVANLSIADVEELLGNGKPTARQSSGSFSSREISSGSTKY